MSYILLLFYGGIGLLGLFIFGFQRPQIALYLAFPTLLFVPYEYRLPIPVVGSPFGMVLLFAAFGGIIRLLGRGRVPRTHFLIPLTIFTGVAVLNGLLGRGDPEAAEFRAKFYILGLWALPLTLLIIDSPRKVRNLLLSAYGSLVIVAGLLVPTIIYYGPSFVNEEVKIGLVRNLSTENYIGGFLSYLVLTAIAISFPIHLSLAFDHRLSMFLRLCFAGIAAVIVTSLLISSYSSPIVALVAGALALGLMRLKSPRSLFKLQTIIMAGIGSIGTYYAFRQYPGLWTGINRILNPQGDVSGGYRIESLKQGILAFLESPLYGHGAYNQVVYTQDGHMMGGHNSYVVAAYEHGLLFIIPLFFMLGIIVHQFFWLVRRTKGRPIEYALAQGMFAGVIGALVCGIITPVLGNLTQDSYLWLAVSVMTIWNSWLDRDPEARLIA